ncbi:hypothetical protein AB0I10_21905 [Streptomyces sp. NPDC050636]|uniref:hypothetical protein n=1 Tax=Streptomyces sp. NPDC050636 TaxID=3154510 RepID=UPI0034323BA6
MGRLSQHLRAPALMGVEDELNEKAKQKMQGRRGEASHCGQSEQGPIKERAYQAQQQRILDDIQGELGRLPLIAPSVPVEAPNR